MLVLFTLSDLFFAFSLALNMGFQIKIISIVLLLIMVAVIWIYTDRRMKNNRESLLASYKCNHINELISLLKSSE